MLLWESYFYLGAEMYCNISWLPGILSFIIQFKSKNRRIHLITYVSIYFVLCVKAVLYQKSCNIYHLGTGLFH